MARATRKKTARKAIAKKAPAKRVTRKQAATRRPAKGKRASARRPAKKSTSKLRSEELAAKSLAAARAMDIVPASEKTLHDIERDKKLSEPRESLQVGTRTFEGQRTQLGQHQLDVLPDLPDIRDRPYRPHLQALEPGIYPRVAFPVRDQGKDSSCTGFALAHAIDYLRFRETSSDNPAPVSARMLYEMAKHNDEWEGAAYEGSSLRGAIKGFFRNGVCKDDTAPDAPGVKDWALTYEMAKEAREIRLGAYYRVEPDITDYHAALNEVGCIYASAQIHKGWMSPVNGKIEAGGAAAGGHAFVIVGYDAEGFWVLNSWGSEWGENGVAHWRYKDWAATIMDAWVLQMGVRSPAAFSAAPRATVASQSGIFGFGDPSRGDIVGHFINMDDGRYVRRGKYYSPNGAEMGVTVDRLAKTDSNSGKGYEHLILYAHGGLNSLAADASRIATWKRNEIFSQHKIYNFHLMWGSGFLDEAFGAISRSPARSRAGGLFTDWIFDAGIGKRTGAYAWRNMKTDALMAFGGQGGFDGGFIGLKPLLRGLDGAARRPKLHLVGHSAGSIVLGHLLSALGRFQLQNLELASIHLMAPACTTAFFRSHYKPYLENSGSRPLTDKIYLYNMTDGLERADTVSTGIPLLPSYSKSLLYLVSRAYEEQEKMPLAGMELYRPGLPQSAKLDIAYSGRDKSLTASTSHGGFDNDPKTIATIMRRITGRADIAEPQKDALAGY